MIRRLLDRVTPEQRRFVKFCVVGASGVGVNLAFVWLGLRLFSAWTEEAAEVAASALGILVSVLSNFVVNDLWTWGDRQKGKRKRDLLARVALYYLASAAAVGIQFGVAVGLSQGFGWNIYAAQLVGIALGTVANYVANNRWTFRDQGS